MAAKNFVRTTHEIAKSVSTLKVGGTYSVPPLPYDYSALEPIVSAEIMELHHKKHHQAYVTNLIKWEEVFERLTASQKAEYSAEERQEFTTACNNLRFNGGGHLNHTFFWDTLCPTSKSTSPSSGLLKEKIDKSFGDIETMIKQFNATTVGVQGSGWGWLGYNPTSQALELATTFNQNPLKEFTGLVPIIGIDVWEHAYYLQYKNMRADYLTEIWKIVNWDAAEKRLVEATRS